MTDEPSRPTLRHIISTSSKKEDRTTPNELSRAERQALMREAIAQLEDQHEWIIELAKAYFGAYEALLKAGFTKQQAFDLVKTRGWNLA